jgi:hypothetical protein
MMITLLTTGGMGRRCVGEREGRPAGMEAVLKEVKAVARAAGVALTTAS